MASKYNMHSNTDRRFKMFTHKWTFTNFGFFKPGTSDAVYSDAFETDHNVSWQAVFAQGSDGKLKCGLKFLGCSVFGPSFSTAAEFSCFTEKSICGQFGSFTVAETVLFEPTSRVFDSRSNEHYVSIAKKLGELKAFPYSPPAIIFKITTRKVGNFIIPPSQLLQDLDPDLNNRELTDVYLVARDTSFIKVHKEILAARSPVFAAMFNTNMLEKQQNSVNINDMSYAVLTQLVKFIYTDKIEIQETMAAGLLAAADKYDLERLKAACEHALFRNVSVYTAIDNLILADKHNAQQLKTHILQFIETNVDDVMKVSGWQTLVDNHPQYLLELYQAMANKEGLPCIL